MCSTDSAWWPLLLVIGASCAPDPAAPTPGAPIPPQESPQATAEAWPEVRPENLLILLLDDVGTDKLTAYGAAGDVPHTPVIDALAAEGVTFGRAWAYATCSPTRAAIMTGQHPDQHFVGFALDELGGKELADDAWTLPRMLDLSATGYAHAAFGKWHLTGTAAPGDARSDPLDKGWSWFQGTVSHGPYYSWQKSDNGVPVEMSTYATTETVDDVLAYVAAQDGPWVVYVAFQAAHAPYQTPPDGLFHTPGADQRSRYHQVVEAADTEIGRLLEGLPPGVRARTTTLLMGDNGTPPPVLSDGTPIAQAKGQPTEGGVRVPLILAGPHVGAPGSWSDALVQATDLFATAAEVAGVPVAPAWEVDSFSLLPLARDPGRSSPRPIQRTQQYHVVEGEPTGHRAVCNGSFKLIQWLDGFQYLADLRPTGREEENLLQAPLDVEAAEAYAQLRASFRPLPEE